MLEFLPVELLLMLAGKAYLNLSLMTSSGRSGGSFYLAAAAFSVACRKERTGLKYAVTV